jgi:hypothetical protein
VSNDGGTETSTNDFDSTDAYAGTFLWAAQEWYAATGDATGLASLHTGLNAALSAIASTQQSDGLTWAKPAYQVKYLLDQDDAYVGLLAAEQLATALSDTAMKTKASQMATAMAAGIDTMWDSVASLYRRAKLNDGTLDPTSWGLFYPDAIAQGWTVALGNAIYATQLVPQARAGSIVGTFQSSFPQWSNPAAFANDASVGYWPTVGLALANVGQASAAHAAWTSIRTAALSVNRAYPFVTANAGQLILLETIAP